MKAKLPLVVIVGPTASGKTGLAIELARRFNGEIISADSRAIYSHMDIGTAKPSMEERAGIPHWGFDLVEPGEQFSAADFQRYAVRKIEEIRGRGRVPLLVGGTGLYVDALLYDYQFGPAADPERRQDLEALTIDELQQYCVERNITLPENSKNKRYLIRAIEQEGVNHSRRDTPVGNSIIVGIATDREVLRSRIESRAEQLFADGVVDEASMLGKKYGWNNEAMTGNIYPLVRQYLAGELTRDEVKRKFVTLDWRLAKRQLTWLRRNPDIVWLPLGEARQFLMRKLAK